MTTHLYSEKTIAELLNVKPSTIGRLRREEGMPHVRIGKLIRFDLDQVLGWLDQYSITKTKQQEDIHHG